MDVQFSPASKAFVCDAELDRGRDVSLKISTERWTPQRTHQMVVSTPHLRAISTSVELRYADCFRGKLPSL